MVEIVYEDSEVVAVNKPAGLLVHADGVGDEPTLVDWITETFPEIEGVGEALVLKNGKRINRPGIVHRLDKDTSGVILITKNQQSFENIKAQFQDHRIQKTYLALVYDHFSEEKKVGVIDRPIGRSPQDFRRWSAQRGARGKMREALTYYEVLVQAEGFALLQLKPKTGRTHQIRVHLKAINHPIVCDSLYAPGKPCIKSLARQALHAREIRWRSLNGSEKKAVSPIPKDIISAISEAGLIAEGGELW